MTNAARTELANLRHVRLMERDLTATETARLLALTAERHSEIHPSRAVRGIWGLADAATRTESVVVVRG